MRQTIAMMAVVAGFAATGWAAGPGGMGGAPRGPDMQWAKILGRTTAFSATIVTTIADAKGEQLTMQNEMAMLDGKTRFEMDMTKMQGAKGRKEDMSQLKSMGMDRQIIIAAPEKRASYMVYPGMQAYVEMPMKESDAAAAADKQGKVERVELGKETVDGHPCIKTKRIITDAKGQTFEALVWEATDLDNFPIQTQHQSEKATTTTLFKNINRAKPAASLFEVPQGYKKYDNMMQMMMGGAMQGRMPGGAPPANE